MTPEEEFDIREHGIRHSGCVTYVPVAVLIVAFLLALSGCRTKEVVTVVPQQHTDTLIVMKEKRDSIWLRDSIYVSEKQRGDTVYVEKIVVKRQYTERVKVDTVYQARVDSVAVPYPVEKEVNKLHGWQRWMMGIGFAAVFGVVLFAVWKIRGWFPP